ncbi:NADP-dependent oxidoreductase domain-containing protein [Podospora didyma]|uniref:NADP-dependent oxidoreductase domain-containing protein n=1 Tax=Podospora didyma TaxID=330526 RepID=A0AAE0U1C1_9PEZI|nr:NADP-dependent oxidoreductase domain-containing protein [Podospora didyma]
MDCFLSKATGLLSSARLRISIIPRHHFSPSVILPLSPRHQTSITQQAKMSSSSGKLLSGGAKMPPMIYGTAWKKDHTADLVYEAIKAGFRAIDTAAMKRHYDEALAGEGIRRAIQDGLVKREELYIQTKFSPEDEAYADTTLYPSIADQVRASVASSLKNLSTSSSDPTYLDSLVLHSPYPNHMDTLAAWTTLQEFVPETIRALGISNTTLGVLHTLSQAPGVTCPPSIVQNRFRRAERAWDAAIRRWCTECDMAYQGFWTLTGNRADWPTAPFVRELADAAGVELETAWYALIQAVGVVVLNGTTNPAHMREDLEGTKKIAEWRETDEGKAVWDPCFAAFRELVGVVG